MRTLYLDCSAGISGDMMLASLSDLLPDESLICERIKSLGIPGIDIETRRSSKCKIGGVRVTVKIDGHTERSHMDDRHHHSDLADIHRIIEGLSVSERVKSDAISIYDLIADAESQVHGEPVEHVHFHEVGALDAVTDIVGTCILIEMLAPEQIIASPVRTGFGHVRCSHGILPIPAPATEHLLRGIPAYAGEYEGEFCTPTGAAIVKYFADRFEQMPLMTYSDVGYGLGEKDFGIANLMRAYMGDAEGPLPCVSEIKCNLDDMTSEDLSYALDLIMEKGALDAFVTPIVMKKGRPAFMLTCICHNEDADKFAKIMLEHTSTSGVRMNTCLRYTLSNSFETVETQYGRVHVKHSSGYGIERFKPEFNDLSNLAEKNGVSIQTIRESVSKRFS